MMETELSKECSKEITVIWFYFSNTKEDKSSKIMLQDDERDSKFWNSPDLFII